MRPHFSLYDSTAISRRGRVLLGRQVRNEKGETMFRPIATVLALLFVLTGCASAGDYKAPISAFAEAAKKARTSLDDFDTTLITTFVEADVQSILMRTSDLRDLPGDCILKA